MRWRYFPNIRDAPPLRRPRHRFYQRRHVTYRIDRPQPLRQFVCACGAEHRTDQTEKFRVKRGVVERHDARAQRLVGRLREAAASSLYRHPRWAQLRIEAVNVGRRRHGELARDRGKSRVAPHLIGKMFESDGAEFQREPDQVRKAQLRAGEIVPSGLGVLGGDAIGRNIDALDIVAGEVLVIEQTDQRLDRGLDVPAAGVRLDVAIRHAEGHRGRQCDGACAIAAGESLHEAVARLDHAGRAFDTLLCQERRLQPLTGGVAGVQPLDVAATVDEGEQAARARGGKPERVGEALGGKPGELAGGYRRAEHTDGGGGMKSTLAQLRMAGAADRDHRLIAGNDRLHQRLSSAVARATERQRRRYHDAARMHRALAEAVIELDAMRGGAAEEGGIDEVGPPRATRHWNAPGRTRRREHVFGARRNVAARACEHDSGRVVVKPAYLVTRMVGTEY